MEAEKLEVISEKTVNIGGDEGSDEELLLAASYVEQLPQSDTPSVHCKDVQNGVPQTFHEGTEAEEGSCKGTTGLTFINDGNANEESNNKGNSYMLPKQLPPLAKRNEVLWKGHLTAFGFNSFKPFQLQAIHAIQEGHDVVMVQPTGSGKSLCFQVPSVVEVNTVIIVISPTVSLIQSQVTGLRKRGIDAIPFGPCAGDSAEDNSDRILMESSLGTPSLAYTTQARKSKLKMIVLDEVHKVFDRDTGFREAYSSLSELKEQFPGIPIMALTATLSEEHLQLLCKDYLQSPVLIKGSVDRSNIKLTVGSYIKWKKENRKKRARTVYTKGGVLFVTTLARS